MQAGKTRRTAFLRRSTGQPSARSALVRGGAADRLDRRRPALGAYLDLVAAVLRDEARLTHDGVVGRDRADLAGRPEVVGVAPQHDVDLRGDRVVVDDLPPDDLR